MTGSGAAAALAAALVIWSGRGRSRVRALASTPRRARAPRSQHPPGPLRRRLEATLAGLAVCLVLGGGLFGVVTGGGVLLVVERVLRRAGAGAGSGTDVVRDLPVACDLLAVCLASGTPIGAAVTAVGAAVPGPLGDRLAEVGALYRLGAPPRQAWAVVPPGVQGLGRVLVRAGESGSAVVPALQRLAADVRAAERSDLDAAVRRAGVWVLAPLGACFLPAFLCLGVVPLVLGIAADVFG